jgi:hypothetical protein
MEINLRYYKIVIPAIESIVKMNSTSTPIELTAICSVATGAHVIACGYYVASIIGLSDILKEHIERLKKFYKIDTVLYIDEFINLPEEKLNELNNK